MELRKVLFWDTDINKIDRKKNAAYIVERVAVYGTLEEWRQLLEYYGTEKIKAIVKELRYLDQKTLNYLSFRFNIPKEKFRCYTHQPSTQTHYPL
jgi:hypothetical protein